MGMGSGNFSNLIGNVANKGGAAGAPAFNPSPFGGKGAPATYDNYRPSYSYASGPSYGNTQLPYGLGSSAPMPGGGVFGQKGGGPTMSPGFQTPSFGGTFNTLNYGRYPGSGIGYYNPTPDPNYNPSRRPPSSGKGGPDIPYVGLPKTPFPTPMPYPEMPGPPAKGLPTPAVPAVQPTLTPPPKFYSPYEPYPGFLPHESDN